MSDTPETQDHRGCWCHGQYAPPARADSGGEIASKSPAETIRRAAALMRKRAEAAPHSPWRTGAGVGGTGYPKFIRNEDGLFVLAEWQQSGSWPAAGDYIASWHPLVALAVADWLDAEAGPQGSVAGLCHALAVARAYLGEGTGEQQRGEAG